LEHFIDNVEFRRQSFIVRLWLDEGDGASGDAAWRGSITHVPSGDHRYVKGFDEIASFMFKYVEQMGARGPI
jgi:hypothetical protein